MRWKLKRLSRHDPADEGRDLTVADKKTDNWMPLWIGAYLADTMKLTTLQHGAYFLLLIAYWRERKALADVDDELRSITKLDRAEWKRNKPVLSAFFKVGNGVWWHKRVEEEIAAANARSEKASGKASKAAQARWTDRPKHAPDDAPSNAPSMPQALLKDMHEECPTPLPIPLPSEESSVPDGTGTDGADDDPGQAEPITDAEAIFALGLPLLLSASVPDRNARSFLGFLRKQAKDDGKVVAAIRQCAAEKALQPVEYLQGCISAGKAKSSKHAGFAGKDYHNGIAPDGSLL